MIRVVAAGFPGLIATSLGGCDDACERGNRRLAPAARPSQGGQTGPRRGGHWVGLPPGRPRCRPSSPRCCSFALFGLTFEHLRSERERALAGGARDLDVFATALAARLDQALAASPAPAPAEALRTVLAANPALKPSRSLLADGAGVVIAADPPLAAGAPLEIRARRRRTADHSRRQSGGAEGAGRQRRR